MPYLTHLADVARRTGYPVTEVPGWKTRGHGAQPAVKGIVAHHTAGRDDMHVVRDGRSDLAGPLSQFWLCHTGTIYVVAAGKCYHNAPSTSPLHTNSNALGIEAENNGSEPWPAVQLAAYKALCAELCREFGLAASAVKGHKEVQPGKPDPHSINMNAFRADVAQLLAGGPAAPLTESWTEKLVTDLKTLKQGANNYSVKTLRANLFARGGLAESSYGGAAGLKAWLERTDFDAALGKDLGAFQREEHLDDDEICGPLTWAALILAS